MAKHILFLTVLLVTFSNLTLAQKFKVSWGDVSKLKFDYADAVPLDDGKLIVLKFQIAKKNPFGLEADYHPILLLVDKNMQTLKEAPLVINEKNTNFKGLERFGDNLFYIYEDYSKQSKITTLHAIRIDEETLAAKDRIVLGAFESDSKTDQATTDYKLSLDSTKVLFFVEGPERKKENKKFFINVMDINLNSIWKRDIELPIGYRFVSIYDQDLTNDGTVIVAIKHYDKEVTREVIRDEGQKTPSYVYKLYVYQKDEQKPREILFDLGGKFVQGTKLTYNLNKQITVAGLFKTKPKGRVNGAFYATLDPTTFEVKNPVVTAFPDDLMEMVRKDGFGSDKATDPGLSNNFRIRHVKNRMNGSVDLIAEYYLLSVTYSSSASGLGGRYIYTYYYGDIVNTNIDKDGKATFTRIPKNQVLVNSSIFLGYYPIVQNDKLILLYNDDRDNVEKDLSKKPDRINNFKRSVFMAAIIDSKGNLTRQSVYDHRDEDYVATPRFMRKVSDGKYMISSDMLKLLKKRTRYGILEIK